MRVYVESNFILELARTQEQASAAQCMLDAAQRGEIDLRVPVGSLIEPFFALARYDSQRRQLADGLQRQVHELGRSSAGTRLAKEMRPIITGLSASSEHELQTGKAVVRAVVSAAKVLPLVPGVLEDAQRLEDEHGLEYVDATVAASVLVDLRSDVPHSPCCFANRNSKDFSPLEGEFEALHCKLLYRFDQALGFITRFSKPPS